MAGTAEYEDSISMMDVLHEQEAMVEDAEAVLGGVDEENCSYAQNYKRQPIYACKTCSEEEGAERAGLCLACANHCHSKHNIVELFTKRNFSCDCGNEKFPKNKCTLNLNKEASNKNNKYNHNFDGLYCTCDRPYPDLERPEDEDEMIQCIICEDWYHSKHLGTSQTPPGDDFGEMICRSCTVKLPFLADYASLSVSVVIEKENSKENVDVEGSVSEKSKDESKVLNSDVDKDSTKKEEKQTECTRGRFKGSLTDGAALFLPECWRQKLCSCEACKTDYDTLGVSYLLDTEDTINFYEQRAREKARAASNGRSSREMSAERELTALNSVDRVTRTEMVTEYNTLSTELRDYLRKFAESGKVVRDEDIKEFFSGLQARKKRRGNDGMPPNNCAW